MKLIVELWHFLKSPNLKSKRANKNELFIAFKQFIVFDIVVSFTWGILVTLLFILFDDMKEVIKSKGNFNASTPFMKILLFSVLAPLLEELAFRLGLKVTKTNISIGLGIQAIIILQLCGFIDNPLYIRLIWMGIASLILYLLLNAEHISFFKKNYNYFVYYNIFLFSIIHISNYTYTSYTHYFFIPFLVSLHIVFGTYQSYARIKYGFPFALFIHGFHNFAIILLSFLF